MNFVKQRVIEYFKPVAWVISWALWALGDLSCRIVELNDDSEMWVRFFYAPYNNLMGWSHDCQMFFDGTGKWWPWGQSSEYPEDASDF